MYSRFGSFMKYNHRAMAKKLQKCIIYTYTTQINKVFSYCEGTKNKVERNTIFSYIFYLVNHLFFVLFS